jgi:hypothetical protein
VSMRLQMHSSSLSLGWHGILQESWNISSSCTWQQLWPRHDKSMKLTCSALFAWRRDLDPAQLTVMAAVLLMRQLYQLLLDHMVLAYRDAARTEVKAGQNCLKRKLEAAIGIVI